jgi:hypothetical protein
MKKLVLIAVIIICNYQLVAQSNNSILIKDTIQSQKESPNIRFYCAPQKNMTSPLIILDGKVVRREDVALIKPNQISSIEVLSPNEAVSIYGSMALDGCVLIHSLSHAKPDNTFLDNKCPFKVYQIDDVSFNTQQDLYNAIRSEVPGVSITNTNLNQTPIISMRGDSNTIVIVDGVRYDASILNMLNPSDIQNIKVVNDVAGSNYFLNGRN